MSREVDFIIVDLETMDVYPSAVILSLGICSGNWGDETFDSLLFEGKEYIFKAKQQVTNHRRTVNQGTVDWWNKQGEEAQHIFKSSDKYDIEDLPTLLWDYVQDNNLKRGGMVLARGPHFDIPMIDDVCRDMEIDSPFPWYAIRDVRSIIDTIYGTTNGYPPNKKEFLNRMSSEHSLVKHNALHDCIIDALMIQEAYEGIEYE
tara:strand:- start:508 stop:1116 length:609 start_codon:yes stop_codon:yes gene_type:complete